MSANPPAFPSVCLGDPGRPASVQGMTLRDWFAGQALAGSMPYLLTSVDEAVNRGQLPEEWAAQIAFGFADALLAARAATANLNTQTKEMGA